MFQFEESLHKQVVALIYNYVLCTAKGGEG